MAPCNWNRVNSDLTSSAGRNSHFRGKWNEALSSFSKHVGEPVVTWATLEIRKRPSLEPVFGLSILGYCRNTVVQTGGLHEEEPQQSILYFTFWMSQHRKRLCQQLSQWNFCPGDVLYHLCNLILIKTRTIAAVRPTNQSRFRLHQCLSRLIKHMQCRLWKN